MPVNSQTLVITINNVQDLSKTSTVTTTTILCPRTRPHSLVIDTTTTITTSRSFFSRLMTSNACLRCQCHPPLHQHLSRPVPLRHFPRSTTHLDSRLHVLQTRTVRTGHIVSAVKVVAVVALAEHGGKILWRIDDRGGLLLPGGDDTMDGG